MPFQLDHGLTQLEATPRLLRAWLQDLPHEWLHANEGPDTWSPFEVVGHLIHGDRTDWMTRVKHLLREGAERPFVPFDRFAHLEANRGRPLVELLDELDLVRRQNLAELRALDLSPDELSREGRHPALGPVTLGQLLATWVVHDQGHIAQIARVLARVNAGEVGPWEAYLPVLRRR